MKSFKSKRIKRKYRVTQETEPIPILLNLININKISRNFVNLNINLCTIISQSFSYFGCFAFEVMYCL